MKMTTQLRELLNSGKTIVAPGVFDGMSAKLVEDAGFKAVYVSGGAVSRSAGYPDIGILSFSEIVDRLEKIVDVVNIPVIADADTGFGNNVNVQRTIKVYERIGVAGLHIEDQIMPKRCGHLANKGLISEEEMVMKIKTAIESRLDKDFLIIARTDAIAVEGLEKAIERGNAYYKAGADMLFIEAPESVEQIEEIAKRVKAPKLINMFYGGKTPIVPVDRLQILGYQLVIIPSDLQRAAIKGMQEVLKEIYTKGDSSGAKDLMVSFKDREKIIETDKYLKLNGEC